MFENLEMAERRVGEGGGREITRTSTKLQVKEEKY